MNVRNSVPLPAPTPAARSQKVREIFTRQRKGPAAGTNTEFIATLRRMLSTTREETIASYVDRVFMVRLNNEREELMRIALEMDVEENEPSILAACNRLGPAAAASAAISACRRQFTELVQERVQDPDEDRYKDR